MRKTRARIGASVICAAGLSAMLSVSPANAVTCPTGWGSLDKASTATGFTDTLTGVRAGGHACWDRVVLDISGPADGYRVGYVNGFAEDGSGKPVSARGGAKLLVTVQTPAYDQNGHTTYQPGNRNELVRTSGMTTLRQAVWLGSFEGQSSVGLGVRARLPFRAYILDGPGTNSRLVIDIAHTW